MSRRVSILLLTISVLLLHSVTYAQLEQKDFPRVPGAKLLTGYPGYSLALTTSRDTIMLQNNAGDLNLHPSFSQDGKLIVSGRQVKGDERRWTCVLQVYSVEETRWRDYGRYECLGKFTISPDDSTVAFALAEQENKHRVHLHLLNLATGADQEGPVISSDPYVSLSWSPDGTRIVFDSGQRNFGRPTPNTISILELATGKITKIADGVSPAWSPSGEWIAYLDEVSPRAGGPLSERAYLIHPDGTGAKILSQLSDHWPLYRTFHAYFAPVWLPDSTKILLNEMLDFDKFTFTIDEVDISTQKMTRLAKGKPPVFGWAMEK